MTYFDKLISAIILGILAPVILMLALWWGSIPFLKHQDQIILSLAFLGFIAGIILDVTLLRGFVFQLFDLPLFALVIIEVFYAVMIYGFFMGFPVFNSVLGIAGGYIVARKGILKNESKEIILKNTNYIIWFSTSILFFACVGSAVLALRERTICSQVKGMFNLSLDVTIGVIWALILVGGFCLLFFQYAFAQLIVKKMVQKVRRF